MSLVDYASSSDEEDNSIQQQQQQQQQQPEPQPSHIQSTPPSQQLLAPPSQPSQSTRSSLDKQPEDVSHSLPSPFEKLPDASALLSSPILSQSVGHDHSSRVAAAMAENASRKREANGSSSSHIRGKIPKGNLPHSKNIPDTGSGLLVPPQLRGRSNVVTEDITKLFVQKKSPGKS